MSSPKARRQHNVEDTALILSAVGSMCFNASNHTGLPEVPPALTPEVLDRAVSAGAVSRLCVCVWAVGGWGRHRGLEPWGC